MVAIYILRLGAPPKPTSTPIHTTHSQPLNLHTAPPNHYKTTPYIPTPIPKNGLIGAY